MVLQELSKFYPELTGHISRHSTGYIGVHLNFTANNIPMEIQISTSDAWFVKQASEHVYRVHRDFEAEIPVRLKIIQEEKEPHIKQNLIKDFKTKHKQFVTDYSKIEKLFKTLHEHTDLHENLPIIEAMLLSFEINQDKMIHKHFDYDKILERRLTDNQGLVNEQLTLSSSKRISPITKDIQIKLIGNVNDVFIKCNEEVTSFELTPMQKFTFNLRGYLNKKYADYLVKTGHEDYLIKYPHFVIKAMNKSTIQSVLFAIDKNTDFVKSNPTEFILDFDKELSDKNIIITPTHFIDDLSYSISRLNTMQDEIEAL